MNTKNKKISIFILILLAIILSVYFGFRTKPALVPVTKPVVETPTANPRQPIELCFAKFGTPNKQGLYDRFSIRMLLDGDKVTGSLKLSPAEKDNKGGKFEGTVSAVDKVMMARTIDAMWNTSAEGTNTTEQLKVIFGEGTANVGFGEMVDRGDGVYVYKNPSNISYSLDLTDVSCTDLAERENVDAYLRTNISLLSPVKAVLGGKWYVVSNNIDLATNSGTVVYEDGHIQEKNKFSYSVDSANNVTNLTILPN